MPYCPECLREFDVSGGYCPHDGTALKAGRPSKQHTSGEDDAMARLRSQGIGTTADGDEYDRFVGMVLDDRYKITRKLGEGGMGVVLYGEHVVIQKPVAVKILKASVTRDETVVKRFIQEARAASRIGHPNIVDVTDFGETPDGHAYQVMEYLDGPTLADLIYSRKKLPIADCAPIVAQMARALAAAHDKGIVHRDLKPENVFLIARHGRTDFVKIVDFGIAKVTEADDDGGKKDGPRLTRAGAVFGTPEYMAPEQASGSSDIDLRADIYSLGAIFYEMLVGKVPLVGNNTVRTLAMVILDEVPSPRTVDPDLELPQPIEDILMKALAKKREDRYHSMDELADALEEVLGKKLAPRIGGGLGSLPPKPPPSGAGIEPPDHPDTVPDIGPSEEDPDDSKPTALFAPTGKRRRRNRASTHDPPFVETARPGYDALEEPDDFLATLEKGKRRAPILAVLMILGVGVGIAGYFVYTRAQGGEVAAADASAASVDGDAAALAAATADAGEEQVLDAGASADGATTTAGTEGKSGKGKGRKGKGGKGKGGKGQPALTGWSNVEVITRPAEGTVFVGGVRRGPDGVTLRERIGTTLRVKCSKFGHLDGTRTLKITKPSHLMVCNMQKKPRCIPGVKNPFENCP